MNLTQSIATILMMTLLQACGFAHVRTNVSPSELKKYSLANIGKIVVVSTEQNADLQDLNREWEALIRSELEELLSRNHLGQPPAGERTQATLSFNVDMVIEYGNRGMRYLTGGIGGAGRGTVKTTLRVNDVDTGKLQYQSESESKLSLGFFGGSMRSTIRENIKKLLDHYPN